VRRVPVVPNLIHLPFAERAQIPEHKLTLYVLNPEHPDGWSKAKFFDEHLGITRDSWEHLRDEILRKLPDAWITALGAKSWREAGALRFGIECEVPLVVDGLNGQSRQIVTGWMLGSALAPTFSTARPR
jgi:hypothetical protein